LILVHRNTPSDALTAAVAQGPGHEHTPYCAKPVLAVGATRDSA
jgi:hypothetical protein